MTPATTILDSRFRLGALIGRGGMSDVYRGVDESTGEDVAVKIVRSDDPALAQRMAREAQTLESLEHPHLVRLIATGVVGEQAYLVMSFVDGSTLAELLRAGPLATSVVAQVGRAVSDALAYVHGRGIVHRDVKPANILIGPGVRVYLGDFGIARFSDASTLTLAGSTVGTVAYMAPEQLEDHHVGPEADVWALGMVLLEALAGRRLYEGSPSEIVAGRLREQRPSLEFLPARWRPIIGPMLERDPTARPSAAEVAASLAGGDLSSTPAAWGPPAPEPTAVYAIPNATPAAGSKRARRGLLAAVGVLVLAGLVAAWVVERGPSDRPARSSPPTSAVAPAAQRPATTTTATTVATASASSAASVQSKLADDARGASEAGFINFDQLTQITTLTNGAIVNAAIGRDTQASQQLQDAASIVAHAANSADTGSTTTATLLQSDLASLATSLGLPTPTATTNPAKHVKHGGG